MSEKVITEKELMVMNHCTCTRSWARAGNHEENCQLRICNEIKKRMKDGVQ